MNLPIPLQSVTMSAEQYEQLCEKVAYADQLTESIDSFLEVADKTGVSFEFKSHKPFGSLVTDIRVSQTMGGTKVLIIDK